MLVLSRKQNERICIGDDIEILVVEVLNGRVRIGIKAPREISIHRSEVLEAICKSQAEGTGNDPAEQPRDSAMDSPAHTPEVRSGSTGSTRRQATGECQDQSIHFDSRSRKVVSSATGPSPATTLHTLLPVCPVGALVTT